MAEHCRRMGMYAGYVYVHVHCGTVYTLRAVHVYVNVCMQIGRFGNNNVVSRLCFLIAVFNISLLEICCVSISKTGHLWV
jgi:hypothetical protein